MKAEPGLHKMIIVDRPLIFIFQVSYCMPFLVYLSKMAARFAMLKDKSVKIPKPTVFFQYGTTLAACVQQRSSNKKEICSCRPG